jgi:predicted transcriptional regulator
MHYFLKISLEERKHFIQRILFLYAIIFSVLLSGCSGEDYGTELTFAGNNELYYTENVTAEEAQALGEYLVKEEFFTNDGTGISIQLNNTADIYEFRMVVIEGIEEDQDVIDSMKIFAYELSQDVFNGANLNIHLCDDTLTTLKVVEPIDYGTKLTFAENNELYYTENVTVEEAQALGEYLVKEEFFTNDGTGISIQLNKAADVYQFCMIVNEGVEEDQDTIDSMKVFSYELSQDVFNGANLNIHLCDDTLTTLKVVEPIDYGTKLTFGGNNELYYTENITVEEAEALGRYLVRQDFFADDGNLRSIQLNRVGNTYEFRMIIKKGLEEDQDVIDSMKFLAANLSSNVFNNANTDIHLCDENFETLRVVLAD